MSISEQWAALGSHVKTSTIIGFLMGLISLLAMVAVVFVVIVIHLVSYYWWL